MRKRTAKKGRGPTRHRPIHTHCSEKVYVKEGSRDTTRPTRGLSFSTHRLSVRPIFIKDGPEQPTGHVTLLPFVDSRCSQRTPALWGSVTPIAANTSPFLASGLRQAWLRTEHAGGEEGVRSIIPRSKRFCFKSLTEVPQSREGGTKPDSA